MNGPPTMNHPIRSAAEVGRAVALLIALIDELVAVVGEENAVLASGLPASLSTLTTRKNELADEFERWVKEVASHRLDIRGCDGALRDAFLARIHALRGAMDENIERLRAAMDASRRRIEAVMQAIREEITAEQPYGGNGRIREHQGTYSASGLSVRV